MRSRDDAEEKDDDPNDPEHPDHDLSESVPPFISHDRWPKPWFTRRWALTVIAVLAVGGLLLPFIRNIF